MLVACGKTMEVFEALSAGFESVIGSPVTPETEMRTHGSPCGVRTGSNRGRHVRGMMLSSPCIDKTPVGGPHPSDEMERSSTGWA